MKGHFLPSPRAFKDETAPTAAGGLSAGIASRQYAAPSISHPNDWLERVYAGRYNNEWQRRGVQHYELKSSETVSGRFIDRSGEHRKRQHEARQEERLVGRGLRDEPTSFSPRRERASALQPVPELRLQDASQAADRTMHSHAGRHPPLLPRRGADGDDSARSFASSQLDSEFDSSAYRRHRAGETPRLGMKTKDERKAAADAQVWARSQYQDPRLLTGADRTPRLDEKTMKIISDRKAAADAQVWGGNQYQDPRLFKDAMPKNPAGLPSRQHASAAGVVRTQPSVMDEIIWGHDIDRSHSHPSAENVSVPARRASSQKPVVAEARVQERAAVPKYPAGIEDGLRGRTEALRLDYAFGHGWQPSREPESRAWH
eukprot:TRINITY_DN37069_c0_g1_i1.p1 TRINITY_DN37069_c0_g1~~TRINITY_DN37069_c0_g1_i1.p1  ORF type:complete len:373 (+),score=54.83 TRINITY_DN37069_c0_g1_i1:176-1294(+)